MPDVTVILPMYNEALTAESALTVADGYFRSRGIRTETIVVNDGSTDQTAVVLDRLKPRFGFSLIAWERNRGKGAALRAAMAQGTGDCQFFMDTDLSTPIEEFDKFLPYLKIGDEVIIGSRRLEESRVLVRQNLIRQTMGNFYCHMVYRWLTHCVEDFNCGFKLFRRDAARRIFSKLTIDRWGYDVEALFLADKFRYRIREIPVIWRNNPHTRVHPLIDACRTTAELLKIRWNDWRGRYD